MSRTLIAAVTTAGAVLLLSACGGVASESGDGPTLPDTQSEECIDCDAGTSEPTDTQGPERNDRGNIVKTLGEEAGITDDITGKPVITFAIDAITPAECQPNWAEYGSSPVNGNLIAIDLRVATAPELAQSSMTGYFTVSPAEFRFVDPDGITHGNLATMSTFGCLPDNEEFTTDILSPGSQYVGKIVLDLPAAHGTLIYAPMTTTGNVGWEWSF